MAAQPCGASATTPSFVSLVNLLRVHSVPSSRLLMNMLNFVFRSENIIQWKETLDLRTIQTGGALSSLQICYPELQS